MFTGPWRGHRPADGRALGPKARGLDILRSTPAPEIGVNHWYNPDLIRLSRPSRHSAELAALASARVTRFLHLTVDGFVSSPAAAMKNLQPL